MENQEAQTSSQTGDATSWSWLWGLLLPIYFLLLLACGIWLVTWGAGAPDSILAVYVATLIISIAGLFLRRRIFGTGIIDRRNSTIGYRRWPQSWFGVPTGSDRNGS
jgi:hypothetical protein